MRKIDAFLSRRAQELWPTAIIWKEEISSAAVRADNSQVFILQREGHKDFIIGRQFGEAKANLESLLAKEMSRKAGRDVFLSNRAQELWPGAVVLNEKASSETLRLNGTGNTSYEVFILQRECHSDIILGHNPGEAKAGLDALMASERSRKASSNVTLNDSRSRILPKD